MREDKFYIRDPKCPNAISVTYKSALQEILSGRGIPEYQARRVWNLWPGDSVEVDGLEITLVATPRRKR